MTPMVLLIVLAALIVVATAVALAGGWQPEGLPPDAPDEPDRARFDVVMRGYRMEQVDAEIARLHEQLQRAAEPQEQP